MKTIRDYPRIALWCEELYRIGSQFPAWSNERARFWSESFIAFITNFLRPDGDVPWFHREWAYLLCRYKNLVILAPRDHGKTSLAAIYYPLWRMYMDRNTTIMLVTSSASVALDELGSIKAFATQSPQLLAGFGDISAHAVRWTDEIWLKRDDYTIKDATVVALGVGSAILSRRIVRGAIIGDDLVSDTEVQTQMQRDRLANWITGVLIPVAEPTEQVVFIGTKKSFDDWYDRVVKGKELKPMNEFAMTNDDAEIAEGGFKVVAYDAQPNELEPSKTLWPAKWGEKELQEKKLTIGTLQFQRNYRNKVTTSETSLFPIEHLQRCYDYQTSILHTHYTTEMKKVIAVDLAIGQDETSSYFVALVLGLEKATSLFRLLHMVRKRTGFMDQVRIVGNLFERFLPEVVVVESNAYQEAFIQALQSGMPAMTVIPFHTDRRKHDVDEGVPALQPIIEAGRYKLPMANPESRVVSETIVLEFNRYGSGERTDTVMASWFGIMRLMGKRGRGEAHAAIL